MPQIEKKSTNLNDSQRKRLKLAFDASNGNIMSMVEFLVEMDERHERDFPALNDLMSRIKGDPGKDYVLTDKDRKIIAKSALELFDMDSMVENAAERVKLPLDAIAKAAARLIEKPKNGETPSREYLLSLIMPLIPEPIPGERGKDGDDADEDAIVERIEKDLPALGFAIRDGLELLQGKDRLKASAIRGLIPRLKKIEARIEQVVSGRGSVNVGGLINTVRVVDLTELCDGVTKTFPVPLHRRVVGLRGTQFPIIYRHGVDFTTANHILTLTDAVSAPDTGQTLIFEYIK